MLSIKSAEKKDVCILSLNGDLVFNELEDFDRIFMEKLWKKPRVIGLDCKHLNSLDSSGLGLFIKFSKESLKSNVTLIFINITEHISTLFDVSKLDSMFEIMSETDFKATYLE
ncbi:MAG: hypothetical protein A2176_10590 [Spirochaetes bacterium RBG_13_51_14]|nr:MAG: hypothetical protein A2176_10590 [Spirochaetes bacterium RBG_13_51_14]